MNKDDDQPTLMTAAEAEQMLGISSTTVTEWARTEKINTVGYYAAPGRAVQHLYLTAQLIRTQKEIEKWTSPR